MLPGSRVNAGNKNGYKFIAPGYQYLNFFELKGYFCLLQNAKVIV